MKNLGVYVHIPFCAKKCAYCDFVSYAGCEDKFACYVDALCKEIKMRASVDYVVDSIFFGGGTPSLIDAELIEKIMHCIKQNPQFANKLWILVIFINNMKMLHIIMHLLYIFP